MNIPSVPHVVLDACVLMSGIVRRLCLRLAEAGLLAPLWTDRIAGEWQRNAARIWAIAPERLQDEWRRMQQAFPAADCGDTTAFEADLRYSDPKDWHVIAAARAAQARGAGREVLIATWNLKDFNRSELRRMQLRALDPDRLLVRCWEHDAHATLRALAGMADDAVALGGQAEPMAQALRRERLFRLARLAGGQPQP
ncbi:PIN domain-containing protein [Orrella sp. JC864]|uniref:PIN domain-containing protein n=1 Tax=Orrella sp. JC864 TaxID=3120298 RepID=UPI0012BD07B6